MGWSRSSLLLLGLSCWHLVMVVVCGIGVNWGTQASHPLPPDTVVQLLRDNGFQKVKLFDADQGTMRALKRSGLEVMVGIPNDMLATLAANVNNAEKWVSMNVSSYINDGVNIKYVAVGNEPFLQTYNGSFLGSTFPALQNIQSALIKAGLSSQVKVTIPLNADVYESSTGLPSGGNFRPEILNLMVSIVKFLSDNAAPFTVNIYPFISLYDDHNFPINYAFFDGGNSVVDGGTTYTNVFDANHDTLVWALQKNGYGSLPIIVGEIGWPTDGDLNANPQYAQRFNQGFMTHVLSGGGTPLRNGMIDAYLFSLIDEDEKSIQPGNFERHWGIFSYDGMPKYRLNLQRVAAPSSTGGLMKAQNVRYLDRKWCVMNPAADLSDAQVVPSVSYACANADCTSLGYQTSCGSLDVRGNISYAFNSYYQKNNQDDQACRFPDTLSLVTNKDPSTPSCQFEIMIDTSVSAVSSWDFGVVCGQVMFSMLFSLFDLILTFL